MSELQVTIAPPDKPTGRPIATVVDARGRIIKVRQLNALEHYRLTQVSAASGNPATANYEIMAASVIEINGVPEHFPTKKNNLEATIGILDFDGLEAVAAALKELAGENEDAAKNLLATRDLKSASQPAEA